MIAHGEPYQLEKPIWSEADFDQMRWHDCRVHAICFDPTRYRILLDIDYIFAWVSPAPDPKYYSFWISPSTLVFDNICDLKIDIESENIEILAIERSDAGRPKNAELIDRDCQWRWVLDTTAGEVSFTSVGYTQFTRRLPQQIGQQHFELSQRDGVSFAEQSI
jgi:hypothetical protein